MRIISLWSALLLFVSFAQAQQFKWNTEPATTTAKTPQASSGGDEEGLAIYYADYLAGQPTSMGEVYHPEQMTAGHNRLPLGTVVEVTRLDNGKTTRVRINDKGTYCDHCVINLSRAAASQLDILTLGRSRVRLRVIGYSSTNPPAPAQVATPASADLVARNGSAAPIQNYPSAYEYTAPRTTTTPATTTTARTPAGITITQNTPAAASTAPTGAAVQKTAPATLPKNTNGQVAILTNAVSGYAVQLGSYSQYANAERHVITLQEKGFNNIFVMQETQANGGQINRVIAAPFTNSSEAQGYLRDLRTYQSMEGVVIRLQQGTGNK